MNAVDRNQFWKQAGAELGQAQLKLELGFASINICCIKLMTRLTPDVPFSFTFISAPLCFTEMGLNFQHAL